MITLIYTKDDINRLYQKYLTQYKNLFPLCDKSIYNQPWKFEYIYSCITFEIIWIDKSKHCAKKIIVNGINISNIDNWSILN